MDDAIGKDGEKHDLRLKSDTYEITERKADWAGPVPVRRPAWGVEGRRQALIGAPATPDAGDRSRAARLPIRPERRCHIDP